jgi:hypothetical protein
MTNQRGQNDSYAGQMGHEQTRHGESWFCSTVRKYAQHIQELLVPLAKATSLAEAPAISLCVTQARSLCATAGVHRAYLTALLTGHRRRELQQHTLHPRQKERWAVLTQHRLHTPLVRRLFRALMTPNKSCTVGADTCCLPSPGQSAFTMSSKSRPSLIGRRSGRIPRREE